MPEKPSADGASNIVNFQERREQRPLDGAPRKTLPVAWQQVLEKKFAGNGLLYQPFICENCGHHILDQAVLLGVVRKKCPVCKFPNEHEFNRVGEEQLLAYMAKQASDKNDKQAARAAGDPGPETPMTA